MAGIASKSQLRMSFLRYALFTVPAVLLLGSLSGALSGSGADNQWYQALAKSPLNPPGWVFGVVWPILYVLLGLSLAMLLHAKGAKQRGRALALFVLQLLLNFAWSPVFFAAHDIRLAMIVIVVMLGLAAAAGGQFFRLRPLAGALMTPYLAWLCFAAALTAAIDRLNPGAGTPLFG
jgi:translocator protein